MKQKFKIFGEIEHNDYQLFYFIFFNHFEQVVMDFVFNF